MHTHQSEDHNYAADAFDEVEMQPLIVELLSDPRTKIAGAELALRHPILADQLEHDILGALMSSDIPPENLYGLLLMYQRMEAAVVDAEHAEPVT